MLTTQALTVARISLGVASLLNAVEMYVLLGGIAGGKVAVPVFGWLPAPTPALVTAYLVAAVTAAVALTMGLRPAASAAVVTVVNVGVFLWDQQTYSSHRLLATLLVAYLIFARADRLWPQLLMMTQLSACYLFAALSKVSSEFLSGETLAAWVWVPLPLWAFTLAAFATVAVELFLAVGFWLRRLRWLAVGAGVALHVSIVAGMADLTVPLLSFAVTCVGIYPLYFVARHSVAESVVAADPVGPLPAGRVRG